GVLLQPLLRLCPPTHPLPLTAALFPYTTLFRSPHRIHVEPFVVKGKRGESMEVKLAASNPLNQAMAWRVWSDENSALERFETTIDRKSTRLNSSHQIISYAVFCLKKKKKVKKGK